MKTIFKNVPVSQFAREIRKAERSVMFRPGIVRFEIEGIDSKLFAISRKNIFYYDTDKQAHINLTGLVSGVIKINKDMKTNKYNYLRVIQFNCGYGWEDCSTYEKKEYSQVKNDLKEYRLSGGGSYRVIDRRVLNN